LVYINVSSIYGFIKISCCRWKVTDFGLPSFLCGQDYKESEADQYKRKKASTNYTIHAGLLYRVKGKK